MSAIEMRSYLASLHAERALALANLSAADTTALDAEIKRAETAYTGAAVTEIAMVFGELFGRQQG